VHAAIVTVRSASGDRGPTLNFGYHERMVRLLRRLPFFRLLAIGQTALLARRHLRALDADDRRRLRELVSRGRSMSAAEREELRRLLAKLEPRAFAVTTAGRLSPVPIPRWLAARLSR
jgi:hypothetical protein